MIGRLIDRIDTSRLLNTGKPRVEHHKDVSKWFLDETLELDFGEDTGRPEQRILLKREYITQFLANGWVIDAVMSRGYGGIWKTTSKSTQTEGGSSKSSTDGDANVESSATSTSNGSSSDTKSSEERSKTDQFSISSESGSNSSYSESGEDSSGTHSINSHYTNSNGETNTSSSEKAETKTDSETRGNESSKESRKTSESSETETTGNSITETEQEGSPYWYSYQHVRLRRRRLQPERVLQSMMDSFTDAYNSGRTIDNERYESIVSLYAIALSRNEREGEAILVGMDELGKDIAYAWNRVGDFIRNLNESAKAVSDVVGIDATADVNRQFDALLAQTKAQMITNGTYNGTVWPSVAAGIERQRAAALVKAKSEGGQISVSAQSAATNSAVAAYSQLLSAEQQFSDAVAQRKLTAVELRNSVLKWMLDFVGSREEVYPELEEISSMAQQLGFSVGAAGNVI